jgi:N-acetyl-1-D-myo-inositol-2-amino-2-deoxy-alpha-D-glucopyranoside deacetylase
MRDSYNGYRALLVHAHPDDETINNGATMAFYAAMGAQVTLVTCTRGEEGEILTPELSHLASSDTDALGEHRETELANAMQALGITDFRFLAQGEGRYRDSGMMGTEVNNRSDVFWQADLEEAADHLVKVIE